MRPLILLGLLLIGSVWCIQAQPSANFSSPHLEICAPAVVQLSDASQPNVVPIVQWEWLVNGRPFSSLPNPALFLGQAGNYDICLHIEDAAGNRDTLCRTAYFTAFRRPQVHYNLDIIDGCSPLLVQFDDSTTLGDAPIRQWRWDFGDGTLDTIRPSPAHVYTLPGVFDVTLVVIDTNGCSDAHLLSNAVTVRQTPTVSITPSAFQPLCGLPATVVFTGQSNISNASYTWNLGDNNLAVGQNITHQYLSTGCFSPTLTVNNSGCQVTVTTNNCITVMDAPTARFSIDDSLHCQIPFTVQLTNQSTNATSYAWSFGDSTFSTVPSPHHTYQSYYSPVSLALSPGLFPVVLTASNMAGCVDRDTQYIYASQVGSAILGSGLTCAPDTAAYRAISGNISSFFNTVNYDWTLDNRIFAQGTDARAYYPDSGIYQVQVVVTDNIGCVDTSSYTARIGITPTIDSFTADTNFICRITDIIFNAYGSSFVRDWYWGFDDNSTGTGYTINHNFEDTGRISGILIASFRGCFDTIRLDTYTVYPPIASFSPITECNSLMVTFSDKSIGADQWYWDFGDPSTTQDTSTLQNPTYTYPDTGSYLVRLIVYNNTTGCTDTFTQSVMLSIPNALFEVPDSLCLPAIVEPINGSTGATGGYQWVAGGAIPFTTNQVTEPFRYLQSGRFPLTLYAYNSIGCYDTLTQWVEIAGVDTNIMHLPIPACRPVTVNFVDSSTGLFSPIVARQWGTGSTLTTTAQVYPFPGPQLMPLQVTNSWGCVFDLEDTVNVGGAFVNFNSLRNVCLGNAVNLIALTNSPANVNAFRPFTYIWDFGDGTRDTTDQIVVYHTYQQAGRFDVCLQVLDTIGCVTTNCKTEWIEVHDPNASFTADTFYSSCPPLEVNFSQLVPSGSQWSWSFGDGSISGLPLPAHVYSTTGFYDVVLRVDAFPGCFDVDTIRRMIQITGPTAAFTNPPTTQCPPYTTSFIASGTNTAQYTWLYGDGAFSSNPSGASTDTTIYTYARPGRYVPILVADDGLGCQISYPGDTITILTPPIAQFSGDSFICAGSNAQYQARGMVAQWDSLRWNFTGGTPTIATQVNPTIAYTNSGRYPTQLIAWQNGCPDTLQQTVVTVSPTPQARFQIAQSDSCAPATIQLLQQSTGLDHTAQLFWQWNGIATQATGDTTWLQQTADTLTVQLTATLAGQCTDTTQQTIVIYSLPTVVAGTYAPVCLGDSLLLMGSTSAPATWSIQGIPFIAGQLSLAVQVDSQQTYVLQATTHQGCTASDTTTIHPLPYRGIQLPDSAVICLGDSVLLGATASPSLNWSGPGLSCTPCPQPWATQTGYYYAQLDTNYACLTTDSTWVQVWSLPVAHIATDSSICAGDSLLLVGSGGRHYQWRPGRAVSDSTAASTWGKPNTTIRYQLIVTDSNGCQTITDQLVTLRSRERLPLPDSSICIGDSLQLALPLITTQILWQGNGLSCQNCSNPSLTPDSTTTVYVHYTNASNCPVQDTVTIGVTDPNTFRLLPVDSICPGDSLTLQSIGNQGAPVQWSLSNTPLTGNNASLLIQPTTPAWYHAQLILNNCPAEDSVWVNLLPLTEIQTTDASYCASDSVFVFASGNANQYFWSPSSYLNVNRGPMVQVSAPNSMTYQVVGTGICGPDTAYVQVLVQEPPLLTVDTLIEATLGETITLYADADGATLLWSPADGLSCITCETPNWTVNGDAVFYIQATDALGCFTLDSIRVQLQSPCISKAVFVPNAFSPDGDGYNDQLKAEHSGDEVLLRFEIYDRWGERVFIGQDWDQGWNGQHRGQPLAPDVYGYFLVFECPDTGEQLLKKGNITLLR